MSDQHEHALLLPAGARLLHIGPPKTGSTTLQSADASSIDVRVPTGLVTRVVTRLVSEHVVDTTPQPEGEPDR